MDSAKAKAALRQYTKVSTHTTIDTASPHRLIQMLMEGALEKIASAKRYMIDGKLADKGSHISWAISIIGGLRVSLDLEQGGEIALNLDQVYEYLEYQLFQANSNNRVELLDEVMSLLVTIKSAWDAIPDNIKEEHAIQQRAAQQQENIAGSPVQQENVEVNAAE